MLEPGIEISLLNQLRGRLKKEADPITEHRFINKAGFAIAVHHDPSTSMSFFLQLNPSFSAPKKALKAVRLQPGKWPQKNSYLCDATKKAGCYFLQTMIYNRH